jgi:peptidoglycan/xylan/chitin deacetylase (PgdA/CDA1 family)
VIKEGVGLLLRGTMRQVGRVAPARQALHRLSVLTRGAGVAFVRVRRLVPDTARGRAHPDRVKGSATTPQELSTSLAALQKTLTFVHMGEALAALRRGQRLQRGLAVLTFDESFAATAELALPVCRALSVPATLFVTTGHLDEPTTLWDAHVHAVVDRVAPKPLQVSFVDRVLSTTTAAERLRAAHRLLLSLASLDEVELARRLAELDALAGGRPAVKPLDRMLTSAELQALCHEPLLSVGAHGHGHLSLASASEAALQDELVRPRERLQQLCGASFIDVVSYPFGRPPYVDDRVIGAARAVGYKAGFTALPGVARPGDHLFHLPRLALGRKSAAVNAYELAGTLAAVDEVLLVASGERERVESAPEG